MNAPAFWAGRGPRERLVLAGIGAAVAAILLFAFVWLPLERSRSHAAAQLPQLRASVAEMRAQAAEVAALRALPARDAGSAPALSTLIASGALTQGNPDSAGVTPGTAADTLVAEYNNLPALSALFDANAGLIAISEIMRAVLDALRHGAPAATLGEIEAADAVLILGEDLTQTAARVALALCQTVRNDAFAMARGIGLAPKVKRRRLASRSGR